MRSFVHCFLVSVILVLCSSQLDANECLTDTYTYRERVGEVEKTFSWRLEMKGQMRNVLVYDQGISFINSCLADGSTSYWQLEEGDNHKIVAKRHGNKLSISGIRDGELYDEIIELDERPWYQPLSYSLRGFLHSDKESVSFWTLRVDTIEINSLRATKKGEEEILVNGTKTLARKVELRAEGFYSHFWHGTYWYRKSDDIFLRYQSVHGPPGTAETVVELIAEPEHSTLQKPSSEPN